MTSSMSMAVLLALAATAQPQQVGQKTAGIAPFVGDEVAAVVRVNLAKWDAAAFSRKVLGKQADDPDVTGVVRLLDRWAGDLKKAGATEVYALIDLNDMPGYPAIVVPLANGADGPAIAGKLAGADPGSPLRWARTEVIRDAVVAGTTGAIDRIRAAQPARRPDVVAALAEGANAPVSIAIVPGATLRRSVEESMPSVPAPLGGGPISDLSRGMSWASIALEAEPGPRLRFLVQAKDADASKKLLKVEQAGLDSLAMASKANPATADLSGAIAAMKPEAIGDRVVLEADLDTVAALASVPIRQAREASQRAQCVNNLKQIGLAMHNSLASGNAFPPAYLAAKDGKPLLSWRVQILPYLGEKSLYDQFHLDEAWDGPHNKTLIARMPRVYACPDGSKALTGEGKTTYLTPRGPSTIFPGAQGIKLQDITDGTSNTILVVDAGDDSAVTWTRPDDWEVSPLSKGPAPWGHHPQGTNFAFADGSVHFLKQAILPKVLEALLSRNGGEVIRAEDY